MSASSSPDLPARNAELRARRGKAEETFQSVHDGGMGAFPGSNGRDQAEWEREQAVRFLGLINTSAGLPDLLSAVMDFFREQAGCEAVGVRLKEGEDYPYYATRGFPEEFVLAENSLCIREGNGKLQRDALGIPVLACLCGSVIRGRFDPARPCFTRAGSFWTNHSTQWLATTSEAERPAHTCGRCMREGYESVALLALCAGGEQLGVLQLNDRRLGRFTAEQIAFWERLGDYLAVAIAKARAEQAVATTQERLSLCLASAGMGTFEWDIVKNKRFWDENVHRLLGTTSETFTGEFEQFLQVIHPQDRSRVQAALAKAVETGAYESDYRAVWPDGSVHHIRARGNVHRDGSGQAVRMTGVCWDVTERKQVEEALRFLAECGSAPSGEDFFRGLARYLAQSVEADFVCIDQLEEGSLAARTLAVFCGGKFQDNVTYTLKDTPCGDVVGKTICCFPRDVRALFPKDAVLQEMLAEGYLGTTLWGTQGHPVGLIALIWRKPLVETRLASSILQLVAVRASGELQRRQAEEEVRRQAEELRASNDELGRFNKVMVGRELRMIELKQEVNELCARLGQPARYAVPD